MALYQKVDGEWVLCQRPYVKYNNVWTACKTAHVKINGAWVRAWTYDATPPGAPMLDLILHEDYHMVDGVQRVKSRWIRVGARMSGNNHDPDVSMIRVLTDYDGHAPTSPLGPTRTVEPDNTYPTEPWSDYTYGPAAEHHDTSNTQYKQWPRNATDGTILKGGKKYHFGAWAVDAYGNWGPGTIHNVDIPQGGVDEPTVHRKEATIYVNSTGSWKKKKFEAGNLYESNTSQGLFFYGYQFADKLSPNSRITSAQIALWRIDGTGEADANMSMFFHGYPNSSALPAAGNVINMQQQEFKIGRVAKGEVKWLDIPTKYYGNMKDKSARGFGFYNGQGTTSDYSIIAGNNANYSGAVHIVWEDPV